MLKIIHAILLCSFMFVFGCKNSEELFPPSYPSIKTLVGLNDGAVIKTTGQGGFLVFGPYIEMKPGVYRLDVKGYLDGEGQSLGVFDVVSDKGAHTHLSFPIYREMGAADGRVIAHAYFEIPKKVDDAEFRIVVDPSTKGAFSGYVLTRVGELPNDR